MCQSSICVANYQASFPYIDRCVKKFFDKLFVKRKTPTPTSNKKEVMICLLFLGKISIQVKKKLRQIFREVAPDIHPRIVFKSPNRLRNSFSFKDKLPQNLDSMLLYKFTCDTCNCVYIGETKRHYQVRAYEHLGVSILTENFTLIMIRLLLQSNNTVTITTTRQVWTTFKLLAMPTTNFI